MPGKKLLVADDSLTIQKVIRLALSNEGYEIQTVSDGNDAIQQISLNPPDVVLIDVSLPSKTAFEVKETINTLEDLQEVRFVLMSSAFEKVDEALAEEVKFHGRLIKPFDPAHLRQVLTDALAQVTAKRMEKTSFIQFPSSSLTPPPPAVPSASPPPPPAPSLFPSASPFLTDSPTLSLEDWEQSSIAPQELPPLPPPQEESIGDLWELDQSSSHITPPPTPDLPLSTFPAFSAFPDSHPPGGESPESPESPESLGYEIDIKQLTESTINPSPNDLSHSLNSQMDEQIDEQTHDMSDFNWNVQEPTIKPPPRMMDLGETQFQLEPPSPPPDAPSAPPSLTPEFALSSEPAFESTSISSQPYAPAPPSTSAPAISEEEIAEMVQEQVELALHKFIQKSLPDLAERLIKAEIHKLLSE